MKRMMHPQHGFHHAYDAKEEARLRATGWVDDTPRATAQAADLVEAAIEVPARRTRGPNKPKAE